MDATYATPEQLIEGLQRRGNGARSAFWHLLRQPVERLMVNLIREHGLDQDEQLLTEHALHAAEAALRSRPAGTYTGVGWNAFRAAVLLKIARLVAAPHGREGTSGPAPLPNAPDYHSDTFFRPYTRLGNQFFGGDWYAGRSINGSLLVFVADVTGHGYFAYLLATALPDVWQHCWNRHPGLTPQPAELLAAMHEQLADSLPDGIFLECTLARLDADGRAIISPAGGTRLIVRRNRTRPQLVKLRGAWIGLAAPVVADQHELKLEQGDELILATDGVFDQLEELGGAEAVTREAGSGTAFEALRRGLERSLADHPQKDDITLVLMRRREQDEPPVFLGFPRKAGDVPV